MSLEVIMSHDRSLGQIIEDIEHRQSHQSVNHAHPEPLDMHIEISEDGQTHPDDVVYSGLIVNGVPKVNGVSFSMSDGTPLIHIDFDTGVLTVSDQMKSKQISYVAAALLAVLDNSIMPSRKSSTKVAASNHKRSRCPKHMRIKHALPK